MQALILRLLQKQVIHTIHKSGMHSPVEKRCQRTQGKYAAGEKVIPGFSTKKGELSTEKFWILSKYIDKS